MEVIKTSEHNDEENTEGIVAIVRSCETGKIEVRRRKEQWKKSTNGLKRRHGKEG